MDEDRQKLVSMYVGLIVGCAALLVIGSVTGLAPIGLNRSVVIAFVGVTTLLYAVMFVTYIVANTHTP
ncbi:hypothetical protein C495_15147 [Natronorubrum sulfidifaciens JCM 14089]|uniref:Uncharacterized protein n=1 Tax=Natronorubrum sulfidifaciens JCM 14089 TaxID=1230460 RepID=L9VZ77_9EURY|nr:hypothetical protein C495_15147 [Natronorubrum sulfidifaciens JCM 14089]